MLKWMADGRRVKPVIPIAVGERSIAFPRRSVKAGVNRTHILCPYPGKRLIPGQPAGIHDVQLRIDLPPVANGHGPFFCQLPGRQVERIAGWLPLRFAAPNCNMFSVICHVPCTRPLLLSHCRGTPLPSLPIPALSLHVSALVHLRPSCVPPFLENSREFSPIVWTHYLTLSSPLTRCGLLSATTIYLVGIFDSQSED